MVNGEKRAIENNWKADELSVMAMVGCLEANFDQVEKVTPPDKQKELLQMRLEFLNMKNQCWNKYVECSADKAEIAEKVHAFVEKHRGDPKWALIFHDTKELMPELHKALLTTRRRAGMDREKDLAFRNDLELRDEENPAYKSKDDHYSRYDHGRKQGRIDFHPEQAYLVDFMHN